MALAHSLGLPCKQAHETLLNSTLLKARHVSGPISGNQFHDLFMCRGKVKEAVTIKTSSFITISRFWNPSHTGHMLARRRRKMH